MGLEKCYLVSAFILGNCVNLARTYELMILARDHRHRIVFRQICYGFRCALHIACAHNFTIFPMFKLIWIEWLWKNWEVSMSMETLSICL